MVYALFPVCAGCEYIDRGDLFRLKENLMVRPTHDIDTLAPSACHVCVCVCICVYVCV